MIHFCLMPSEPKKRYPNSGILSRNDRAAGNPNAAPYAGQLDIDCPHCQAQVQMWINAWVKDGSRGKFFSLRFKDKNAPAKGPTGPANGPRPVTTTPKPATLPFAERQAEAPAPESEPPADDYRDDDIKF